MINNRQQNGRRRGRNGPRPQGGAPRIDGGNRIDNRARGNAAQLHEKYKSLANDAQRQGDRVLTEYYFQFADHYFRILAESRPREEQGAQRYERNGRYDPRDEFGEGMEGEEGTPDEGFQRADEGRGPRSDQQRDDQPRDDQGRATQRERQDRDYQPRDYQNRDTQPRDFQSGERQQARERPDRGSYRRDDGRGDRTDDQRGRDGQRDERPRYAERAEDTAAQPAPVVAPVQSDPIAAEPGGEEPRRRRGRPRRSDVVSASEGVGERIEIDRLPPAVLPPAVNVDAAPANDTGAEEAPRRRRTRRPREDGAVASEA